MHFKSIKHLKQYTHSLPSHAYFYMSSGCIILPVCYGEMLRVLEGGDSHEHESVGGVGMECERQTGVEVEE